VLFIRLCGAMSKGQRSERDNHILPFFVSIVQCSSVDLCL
jgi:hypothetical protein